MLEEFLEMMDHEKFLILAYEETAWNSGTTIPDCPVSEHITVALAVKRYDLLPNDWADPLEAYHRRLDSRQRAIVDRYRGW